MFVLSWPFGDTRIQKAEFIVETEELKQKGDEGCQV